MTEKKRLDVALFERGFAESREKAKALIMAGQVYVNNQKALKSGDTVKEGDCLEVRGDKLPFVSRGGLKLQKAVDVLPGDTPEVLQRRVMEQAEWVILPQAAEIAAQEILSAQP